MEIEIHKLENYYSFTNINNGQNKSFYAIDWKSSKFISNIINKSDKYINNMHVFDIEIVDKLSTQSIEIKTSGDTISKKD